jgi:hypothetical protein
VRKSKEPNKPAAQIDLESVPYEDLAAALLKRDDLLKRIWAARNGAKGGKSRGAPTDDPAVLAKRADEAERVRAYRQRKKLST